MKINNPSDQPPDQPEIRGGPGVLVRRTQRATTLRFPRRTFGWDHPFAVHYYKTQSQITPGTINGMYPTIKGRSIKPDSKGVSPLLDMQQFDGAASWVVVEIERSKVDLTQTAQSDPTKPLIKTMEVKHVQNLNDMAINAFYGGALAYPELPGNKTRLPLARIEVQQFGEPCFQIAYFNYNYTIKVIDGHARNYFYPA